MDFIQNVYFESLHDVVDIFDSSIGFFFSLVGKFSFSMERKGNIQNMTVINLYMIVDISFEVSLKRKVLLLK